MWMLSMNRMWENYDRQLQPFAITPAGIVELIDSIGVDVTGMECVVIGRSNIVGKPMAMLMLHKECYRHHLPFPDEEPA